MSDTLSQIIAELREWPHYCPPDMLADRLERIDAEQRESHAFELDSLARKAGEITKELRERLAVAEKYAAFWNAAQENRDG